MTEAATADQTALEEVPSRVLASMKRKAWAKSRDSWQASECEDVATEASKATQEEGTGHIPNEKIAIWLKDCRTPLGASLDEQNNPVSSQKGMLLKNGGSFEDDLSLGAEANHLLQRNLSMDTPFALLAKDRRLQFHQKGRSMNSTGSGKSSTTVSSVSELLDLYEEDPEEILYNLGFGKDEPDIASKIPSRFFNNCSLAHGIDIKLFLNAQMQRLEVENPNFALTSRFRQIKVLTEVANAFSSLYSQVSGTPLQRIGSSKALIPDKDQEPTKPAPLVRSSSRLMETISKLNLYGNRVTSDCNSSVSDDDKRQTSNNNQEGSVKIDQKLQKLFKKNSPPLATVSEEASNSGIVLDLNPIDPASFSADNLDEALAEPCTEKPEDSSVSQNECDISGIADSSAAKNTDVITDQESESYITEENPNTSTPEKELYAPNKAIMNLISQPKDSFELEELQGSEDEPPLNPPTCHAIEKLGKDNLLRTASQHSDSSGFAEDTSADCLLASLAQGQESLQAMGSSADSCDSETTVTSVGEDLRTPLATEQPGSTDFDLEDQFLTPSFMVESKAFFSDHQESRAESLNMDSEQINPSEECKSHEDLHSAMECIAEESDLPQDYIAESEIDTGSEYETVPYTTHHISELVDSYSDYEYNLCHSEKNSSCSLDRVHVALQRAQMKVLSSSGEASSRTGRSMITSKDLIKKRENFSNSGYPLRRTQSLPSALLNPVRVVSKVNIVLTSGKATVCSPPTFSYKYTPEEEDCLEQIEEDPNTNSKPDYISPKSELKEMHKSGPHKIPEDPHPRPQSCTTHASHRSQSSCSLHSLLSDWHEKPLCDHGRAWSTHSVPNFSGAPCGNFISPFTCPVASRFPYGSLHRSCSGCTLPVNSPPSTTEMQLRRVLHDIRSSLQNLSQHSVMRGSDGSASGFSMQRSSVLPLYENTFQELQIMRRSLNLFRTQMMDLELSMLRQQTMVYQHLTEDERYEADQLQGLRNSVRMELQELELQLDERLLALEEQLRNFHVSSPFQRHSAMGMYRGRSTDNLAFSSPLNVIEPVTELIREQTHLKSELGLEDLSIGHGRDRCDSMASDNSSLYSSPLHKHKKGLTSSCDSIDKSKPHASPSKNVFRASVALTPSPPAREGDIQKPVNDESPENYGKLKVEPTEKPEQVSFASPANESTRWSPEESKELQQVIREIKESIVGDIRREIVSGLLAAVSSPIRSLDGKADGRV
ncbi:sperm-specific antigen 2 [Xenopus tropicalis]|uniref:Sperm-specific antigen 2 n=1 Tax=Xenopus tropicalis TaxID=8364 RepID=A0A8J0PLY3_XENTR|eukprot:XP_017952638.1 PREDICTED: sperm-specific antigen 2 isoform X1 [Xenopus tropicalis]